MYRQSMWKYDTTDDQLPFSGGWGVEGILENPDGVQQKTIGEAEPRNVPCTYFYIWQATPIDLSFLTLPGASGRNSEARQTSRIRD